MTENNNYWAEVAAQREDERRLQVVAGIPVEDLEQFSRYYWGAIHEALRFYSVEREKERLAMPLNEDPYAWQAFSEDVLLDLIDKVYKG